MARQLRDAQCHTIWEGTENILCLDVRRAMQHDQAHEALLDRVERVAGGVVGVARHSRPPSTPSPATLADARAAAEHLIEADTELQLLHARRFSYLLADLAEGALLLDEATWIARSATATRAKRSWPGGSRTGASCRRASAASSTTTARSSTSSSRSCATARRASPRPPIP